MTINNAFDKTLQLSKPINIVLRNNLLKLPLMPFSRSSANYYSMGSLKLTSKRCLINSLLSILNILNQGIWALATTQREQLQDGFDSRGLSICILIDAMFIQHSQRQEIKAGIICVIGHFRFAAFLNYLGFAKQTVSAMKGAICLFSVTWFSLGAALLWTM